MNDRWREAGQLLLVAAGIVLGQAVLYGPSLVGTRVLLPVDLLATPGEYLPLTPETRQIVPHDFVISDQIFDGEMSRQFALAEVRAGRLPLWCPNRYAGAPCFRWSFSPPVLPAYFIAAPVVLAWVQVLIALVAG